jgi:hypothetical protein
MFYAFPTDILGKIEKAWFLFRRANCRLTILKKVTSISSYSKNSKKDKNEKTRFYH